MDNYIRLNSTFTKDPILTQANLTIKDSFDSSQKLRGYQIYQTITSSGYLAQSISSLQNPNTSNSPPSNPSFNQSQGANVLVSSNILNIQNNAIHTGINGANHLNLNYDLNHLDQHNAWIDESDLCHQENSLFSFSEVLGDLNPNPGVNSKNGIDHDLSDTSSELDSASSSNFGIHSYNDWGRSSGYGSEVSSTNNDETDSVIIQEEHFGYYEIRRMRILQRERQRRNGHMNILSTAQIKGPETNKRKPRSSTLDDIYTKKAFIYYNDSSENDDEETEVSDSELNSSNGTKVDENDDCSSYTGTIDSYASTSKRLRLDTNAPMNLYPKKNRDEESSWGHKNYDFNQPLSCDVIEKPKSRCLKRPSDIPSPVALSVVRRRSQSRFSKPESCQQLKTPNAPNTRASYFNRSVDKSSRAIDSMQPTSGGLQGKNSSNYSHSSGVNDNSNSPGGRQENQSDGRRRHLLHFIIELLNKRNNCVEWVNKTDRIFQISNPNELTRLWGQYKKNTKMTFESLSRSLRLYYAPKKLERIQGRRHQYRLLSFPSKPSPKLVDHPAQNPSKGLYSLIQSHICPPSQTLSSSSPMSTNSSTSQSKELNNFFPSSNPRNDPDSKQCLSNYKWYR